MQLTIRSDTLEGNPVRPRRTRPTDEALAGEPQGRAGTRLHETPSRPFGMAIIGTMVAEEHSTPELLEGFRHSVVSDRRAALLGLLQRTAPAADDDLLTLWVDLTVGAFYARYIAGQPFPRDWAEKVASCILVIVRRQTPLDAAPGSS